MPRIASIAGWATDIHDSTRELPRGTFTAARSLARVLKRVAKEMAPRHTGALVRSIRVVTRQRAGQVDVALTSSDPAAGTQETGGLIRMGSRLMTVPIGVERAYWDATGTRREARDIPGLFKITAKNGRQYLVTRQGRTLILRFALRESVLMPAQYWASNAVREASRGLDKRASAMVVDTLLSSSVSGAP